MTITPPEVIDFAEWRPHLLFPQSDPQRLYSSFEKREAAFYDKHIDPRLALRHIRYDSRLLHRLASVVDKQIEQTSSLPDWSMEPTAVRQATAAFVGNRLMCDKYWLLEYYRQATARFAAPIACTIALHPTFDEWNGLLKWRKRALDPHCFVDACLEWGDPSERWYRALWNHIKANTPELAAQLRESSPVLVPLEFKTLENGSRWLRRAVHVACADLENSFDWRYCRHSCSDAPQSDPSRAPACGLDATDGLWIPNLGSEFGPSPPKLDPEVVEELLGDDDDYDLGGDAEPERLFQQASPFFKAWSQSVKYDTTFLVINTGRFELIGFRHRKTQTLFISDCVEVHSSSSPPYGKIHIGLYVSAILDAIARHTLKSEVLNANTVTTVVKNSARQSNKRKADTELHSLRTRARIEGNMLGKGSQPWTVGHARACSSLRLSLDDDIYSSKFSQEFVRIPEETQYYPSMLPSPPPTPTCSQDPHDFQASIALRSVLGSGRIGVVHDGTLTMQVEGTTYKLDVVAKLAFSDDDRADLLHEFKIYKRLRERLAETAASRVPTYIGLFRDTETPRGPALLVLTREGEMLEDPVSIDTRNDLESTLKAIHEAGVLHGDIRWPNILENGPGGVAITDFDAAKLEPDPKECAAELATLSDLLLPV